MRQAGFMAAAGIYALENNIERLKDDHVNAKTIADAISSSSFAETVLPVDTNIIIFSVKPPHSAPQLVQQLKQENILGYAISPTQVRLVLHLDITPGMVNHTVKVIRSL